MSLKCEVAAILHSRTFWSSVRGFTLVSLSTKPALK